MLRRVIHKGLKQKLIIGMFFVFIMALSMVGVTHAWFTDVSITIANVFTAGTVEIEVVDESENDGETTNRDIITPGEPFQKSFNINNLGSKSIYVRAIFEGYWEKIYHRNMAQVTANYNGIQVTDSNKAHYFYENIEPLPDFNNSNYIGFNDNISVTSHFDIVVNSSNDSQTSNTVSSDSEPAIMNNENCPRVEPIPYDKDNEYFKNAFNNTKPYPGDLPFPKECSERYMFKIDLDDDDIEFGKSYKQNDDHVSIRKYVYADEEGWQETIDDIDTNFEVEITDWDDDTFKFDSTIPVYHVYVKGGPGGNLYPYYHPIDDPAYPNGITSDCGLSQPGGNWSHIVFYYCDELLPDIEILKEVSVDGGTNWENASTSPGPELVDPEIKPMFRFTVTNTGNVPLTDIVIEDDVLDLTPDDNTTSKWTVSGLDPEESRELEIEYEEWMEKLSLDNFQVELCEDMDNWVPEGPQDLGTYFYHTEVLEAQDNGHYEVTLCVDILFDDNGHNYEDAKFILYAYFEAVQDSNDIIQDNWPEEDLDWYLE